MRIVHVVRQFHPNIGGLETFVMALARQQIAQGHAVRVVTLDRVFSDPHRRLPEAEVIEGIDVRRLPFRGSHRYAIAPGVLRHIGDGDIVHVHGVDFFCDYLAATALLHGKPMVLSTHGGFFHTPFAKTLKRLVFATSTRLALRQYRRVFACSKADFDIFRPITGDRLTLVENGVETEKFAAAASPGFQPNAISVGRISSNKGLIELVEAFAPVVARFPEARLHIVGKDFDGTLAKLHSRIAGLEHRDNIVVHGCLEDGEVRELMRSCSFFVSASSCEGFGIAMIEAMAAGLVVIGNRIPAYEALLADKGLGLLTDFFDPAAAGRDMAQFMERSMVDYAETRARGMALAQRYNWGDTARRFTRHYERVLGLGQRELFGVQIAVKTRRDAVRAIDAALAEGTSMNVAFANAHTLNIAAGNARFRQALANFVVLNDGLGVDIASRYHFGRPFEDNLNGTDFVPHFLDETGHALRIFLLGSSDAVVTEAARRFGAKWPRHVIVGQRNGFFSGDEELRAAIAMIRETRPDVVLVGFGNPLQELWIDRYAAETGAKVHIGVGALFDFTAGKVSRAPAWVREMRCEWLYRLLLEPRRLWRRYLVGNAQFMVRLLIRPRLSAGE